MSRIPTHRFVKLDRLVHLTRESIDQEPTTTVLPSGIEHGVGGVVRGWVERFSHGVFEELSSGRFLWYAVLCLES